MDRRPASGRNAAAIAGHLLHPLLVTFPVAFLIGALLTDLAFAGHALHWHRI